MGGQQQGCHPEPGGDLDHKRGHADTLIAGFEIQQNPGVARLEGTRKHRQCQNQVAAGPDGGGEDVGEEDVAVHASHDRLNLSNETYSY